MISTIAYHITDGMIQRFKGNLADRGLFGKDLNKGGEDEQKEKM